METRKNYWVSTKEVIFVMDKQSIIKKKHSKLVMLLAAFSILFLFCSEWNSSTEVGCFFALSASVSGV